MKQLDKLNRELAELRGRIQRQELIAGTSPIQEHIELAIVRIYHLKKIKEAVLQEIEIILSTR